MAVIPLANKLYESEAQLSFDLFDCFGTVSWMRMARHNVGAAKINGSFVRFNNPGESDIRCILNYAPNHGRHFWIECKVFEKWLKEKQSKKGREHLEEQQNFRDMITDMGGIACQVFQVSDVFAILASVGVPDNILQAVYDNWKGRNP